MRQGAVHILSRYRAILATTGGILVLSAMVMVLPLAGLVWWPEEAGLSQAFLVPAGALGLLGGVLRVLRAPQRAEGLSLQEAGVVVVLSWGIVSLFSAFPFAAGL